MLDQHCRLVIQGPEKLFKKFYKSFPIFKILKKNQEIITGVRPCHWD